MSKSTGLGRLLNQWGGTSVGLFTYSHLGHDLATGLLAALLPFIKLSLGLTYFQSGTLIAAYAVTSGVSQFVGGLLGDRLSRQLVMGVGLAGVGLTALGIGLVSDYYILLLALVILGVVAGAYHPSAISMLSGHFEEARRGRAIALYMLGGSIGFMLGPVLGGQIAETLGWRTAFMLLGIPALTAVPMVLIQLRPKTLSGTGEPENNRPVREQGSAAARHGFAGLGQVLRPVALVTALAVVIQFAAGSVMAFFTLYLVGRHTMTAAHAAMWLGIVRTGGMAGTLFGGWLSDRWGRVNSVMLALGAAGPIVFLLANLPLNAALFAVFFLFGVSMQMRQATVQPYLMDNTPPHFRATVFGIYFGLGMEGMSIIQPVVGYFIDIIGIQSVFQIIAWISVALSLLTLLLIRKRAE